MKQRILVVDDEAGICQVLEILLGGEGYEVILASSGEEALEKFDKEVALVVLDVGLPGMSGYVACSKIREQSFVPVLFLTAYGQDSDKTMGFSAGGDDYLTKPFSNGELLLRVKALLRRAYQYQRQENSLSKQIIVIEDLELDLDQRLVKVAGEAITLTSTEYEILKLLMTNRKKIFSISHIYQSIWKDDTVIGDNAVMVHIRNLRKKLERDSKSLSYIKTAWGKGYYVD